MDQHIRDLFENAQPFDKGELYQSPEYDRCFSANLALEKAMRATFGPKAHRLLMEFLDSYYEIERFNCLHYFHQGYLAAKRELEVMTTPKRGGMTSGL